MGHAPRRTVFLRRLYGPAEWASQGPSGCARTRPAVERGIGGVRDFLDVGAMLVLALGAVAGLRTLHRLTALGASPLIAGPFLSGALPTEHALSRFHARWYAVTLLFLAFDVEMLFMYPWAVVVAEMGVAAVVEMFLFLGLLMCGVVYAWREGALRWA